MAAGVEPEYNALTVTPPGHTSDSLRPSSTVKYLMACYTCACDMRLAYRIKQVCVDSPPSALNMTLPASAAERRHLQHGARSVPVAVDRCFLLAGRSAATPPAAVPAGDRWYRQTDRRTDGRTPDRYIVPAAHTMRAVSTKNSTDYRLCHAIASAENNVDDRLRRHSSGDSSAFHSPGSTTHSQSKFYVPCDLAVLGLSTP